MRNSVATLALSVLHFGLIGGIVVSTFPTPASAQGTLQPVASEGATCAAGWSNSPAVRGRIDTSMCYPTGSSAREVYRRHNGEACRTGYNTGTSWCEKAPLVTNAQSSSEPLTKPAKSDRCPTGWFTTGSGLTCVTQANPTTSVRRKDGKPCKANEVDEWGVWCTSNYAGMTAGTMNAWAMRDYNAMYAHNGGVVVPTFAGANLDEKLFTPVRRKVFGDGPVQPPAAGATTPAAGGTTAADANTPARSCDSAAAQGAAVGGAVAGTRGRALGGMAGAAIGAMGPKKKPGC